MLLLTTSWLGVLLLVTKWLGMMVVEEGIREKVSLGLYWEGGSDTAVLGGGGHCLLGGGN